jgi:hypothetical protein
MTGAPSLCIAEGACLIVCQGGSWINRTSSKSFAFLSNTSKSKYDFAMLNVTILNPSLLPLMFVKLDIRRVQVSIAAPAVLLESTHLGIFGFNPFSIEAVVPERALAGIDIAVVSATCYALELVGTRVARRSRMGRRSSLCPTLAQPAASLVLFGPVRASARRAFTGGPAGRSGMTPSPAPASWH